MLSFDGAVKLLDFGIAKALAEANENKTQTGTLKGKFGYMSPEQVEGKDIDHRADLFAAGIVLHEVLTGRRLFKGQNDLQTIAMVREGKVDPPSTLNDQVPPELDRICLKALSKNREERYASCDEMAVELDDVVHHLKFGPEKLAAAMKELFPEEPSQTGQIVLIPSETAAGSNLTIGALRRHERRRNVAFGSAVLALLGGVAWLIAAKVGNDPVVPPPETAKIETPTPAPSSPPQAPPVPTPEVATSVRLDIASKPEDCKLYREGVFLGMTPRRVEVPRGDVATKFLCVHQGYEDQIFEVVPDHDQVLETTLKARPVRVPQDPPATRVATPKVGAGPRKAQPAPPPKGGGTKPAAKTDDSKPGKQPGESIKGGGLADPFENNP
jgi:hypothetical protein